MTVSLGAGPTSLVDACAGVEAGVRPVVHVAGRHAAALCPGCERPSMRTNGHGWRDVVDVVRTLVVTLPICVRRFLCESPDCPQRSFDERFEGIDRGGASHRALGWFADLARGRATRAVARVLSAGGPSPNEGTPGRPSGHHEGSVRKNFVYATVFSDPARGVVIDLAPGRDASAVLFFAGLFSHAERAKVQVVTIDCHAPTELQPGCCSPTP